MAAISHVSGVDGIVGNLRLWGEKLFKGTNQGLLLAGMRLQRESQRLVPVETGNLKASAYTKVTRQGFQLTVQVGYTAAYASFVHEAVGMVLKGQPRPSGRGRFWDPQGIAQAKFLEEPARRLSPDLMRIIRENTKIL